MTRIALVVVLSLVPVLSLAAQQPSVSNGRIEPHAITGPLEREIRALASKEGEPAWIGYAVPARTGDHRMCCFSGDSADCCSGCRLEPGVASAVSAWRGPQATPLESGDSFFVLYRFEKGELTRIRIFSEECPLDAGGRTLHWLTGVREDDSVALLATFTSAAAPDRRLADSALSALAMHRAPAALERLLTAARTGASTHVRGQALFWLAQRAGEKAVGAISDAIANDPETDVKRRAVFALSQLPKDQGVPLLIDVARMNPNPAVRKQAMFWLGQSRDPRAVQFFEQILFK
jgi:hypothetical protein